MRFLMCFLILGLAVAAVPGYGDQDAKRKFTLEYDAPQLSTGNGARGWLAGVGYLEYFGMSPISLGPVAYFGSPTGQSVQSDNLTMAGLRLDADGYFAARTFVFRVGIYGAYAAADLNTVRSFTGWVLEPSADIGVVLGAGWRLSAGAGYLYCPQNSLFSGVVFNLLLERKVLQQTKQAM